MPSYTVARVIQGRFICSCTFLQKSLWLSLSTSLCLKTQNTHSRVIHPIKVPIQKDNSSVKRCWCLICKPLNPCSPPPLSFYFPNQIPCYFLLFSLFLGLLDLLHLAGLVHHFAVDHRLSHHLHDLPGADIRLLCTERWDERRRDKTRWEETRQDERRRDETRREETRRDEMRLNKMRGDEHEYFVMGWYKIWQNIV